MQHGALAIFGPSDQHLGAHVQSICDALEIPHLEVRTSILHHQPLKCVRRDVMNDAMNLLLLLMKARLDMDAEYKPYSINVYPPVDLINKAFMDVMFFLNWTKVAIIYEEDQGTIINNHRHLHHHHHRSRISLQ